MADLFVDGMPGLAAILETGTDSPVSKDSEMSASPESSTQSHASGRLVFSGTKITSPGTRPEVVGGDLELLVVPDYTSINLEVAGRAYSLEIAAALDDSRYHGQRCDAKDGDRVFPVPAHNSANTQRSGTDCITTHAKYDGSHVHRQRRIGMLGGQ